jgi:hypothetical protein
VQAPHAEKQCIARFAAFYSFQPPGIVRSTNRALVGEVGSGRRLSA